MSQSLTKRQYDHAVAFYNSLSEKATDSEGILVYIGKISDAYQSAGIPPGFYSVVKRILESNESIQIIQKGTRGYDSVVALLKPLPPFETVSEAMQENDAESLTTAARVAKLEQRLEKVEGWRESFPGGLNIVEVLRDFEKRLAALEAKAVLRSRTKKTGNG